MRKHNNSSSKGADYSMVVGFCQRTALRFLLLCIFGLAQLPVLSAEVPPLSTGTASAGRLATNLYTYRPAHDPDGTGKFYCGREIALVMGHEAASWLERPERNQEENTDLLVQSLPLKRGMVVADIGAGTGYLSRRMAAKVGAEGKVVAQDIQPEMLTLLLTNASRAGITNIETVLGTVSDPNLAANCLDLAILVDVYHELEFPFEMMQAIAKALKREGKVVFVEFRGEDENVPIKPLHKMTEIQLKKEMSRLQLKWLETKEVLPWQHIVTFVKE